MASVQRDQWCYVVLQCLLLNLLLCRNGTFADKNKYYHISTLCMKERNHQMYKKIDGTVLTSEGEDNLECVITFQTDTILQRFMLRFERLALDCNDHLYVFDGAHAFGNYKADLSCRSTRADVGTIFTQSNFVTLKYETDKWSQSGNGFRLVITTFKDSPVGCRDFHCMNSFCIAKDLTCDGVNHCGDNSDETSYALCVGQTHRFVAELNTQGSLLTQFLDKPSSVSSQTSPDPVASPPNVMSVSSAEGSPVTDETAGSHIMGLSVGAFSALVTLLIIFCVSVAGVVVCVCRRARQQPHNLQHQTQNASTHPPTGGHPPYPTAPRYTNSPEQHGEKPPPYPGGGYSPGTGITYNVHDENLYYPTK